MNVSWKADGFVSLCITINVNALHRKRKIFLNMLGTCVLSVCISAFLSLQFTLVNKATLDTIAGGGFFHRKGDYHYYMLIISQVNYQSHFGRYC
jgi:hypothetical protein